MSSTTTLANITKLLLELEATRGSSISIADMRIALEKLFAPAPTATKSPGSNEMCAAMTKSSPPKKCSKKGTILASDQAWYCSQHHSKAFPDELVAKKPAVAVVAKKTVVAVTVASSSVAVANSCEHEIKGDNARVCGKGLKGGNKLGTDGKYYCSAHIKTRLTPTGATGDSKATKLLTAPITTSTISMNSELGLGVDKNGFCYVADYNDNGATVCGRLRANVLTDITPEDEVALSAIEIPVAPAEYRIKVLNMSVDERQALMNVVESDTE